MNEKRTIVYDGVELSSSDAIDFFNEIGTDPDAPCPVCRHPDWGISMSPGEGLFPAFPTITQDSNLPSRFIVGVYTSECLRCGYIRAHSLSRLAAWKKGTLAPKGDANE